MFARPWQKFIEDDPLYLLRFCRPGFRHIPHKANNLPDRFELFLLDEGQQKVEEKQEQSSKL